MSHWNYSFYVMRWFYVCPVAFGHGTWSWARDQTRFPLDMNLVLTKHTCPHQQETHPKHSFKPELACLQQLTHLTHNSPTTRSFTSLAIIPSFTHSIAELLGGKKLPSS